MQMRIVILNQMLQQFHKDKILGIANTIGAKICFAESESTVPEEFAAPDLKNPGLAEAHVLADHILGLDRHVEGHNYEYE